MPSLISQIRNGTTPSPQQSQTSPQLNNTIQDIKRMMQQVKMSSNPQMMLEQLVANNPMLANIIKSNGNLEAIAREMASQQGIDINLLISQLKSGL